MPVITYRSTKDFHWLWRRRHSSCYLYVDLGSINYTSSSSSPANPLATTNHDHRIVENIGRVGVNYRFNAGPVVAKY